MLRTRVGYAGGSQKNPTYRSMGDHTEAISIDFDPKVLSYEKLLSYFWQGHRCQSVGSSRQYMNAVFYRNDSQKKIAQASLEKQARKLGISPAEVTTKILPVNQFTYAENYHQKYYLTQQHDIRAFLSRTYPNAKSLADSTVATRLNAYLATGTEKNWETFLKELPDYQLPNNLHAMLKKYAERKAGR